MNVSSSQRYRLKNPTPRAVKVVVRKTELKRVRLGSIAIASVVYDEKKRTLDVEFREGETYRYMHVPEFVYLELLKAESAGAFLESS